ncbi:type II toxin-antitoxin system RelE/ParE family toxin [Campylobacter hyointestinalis]|uniref:type II toxin-antitoxin system RelE/ParE family toxin n=1 Tax=Campylobacter hyointestinalis TaxID=198 RepID=UPI001C6655E0|nr:type II toxin-antitoxin system RelE/ParE family toxin [Campylobacter hyointestinalis]
MIKYSDDFINDLEAIADFIAKDSMAQANKFIQNLKIEISKIPFLYYIVLEKIEN